MTAPTTAPAAAWAASAPASAAGATQCATPWVASASGPTQPTAQPASAAAPNALMWQLRASSSVVPGGQVAMTAAWMPEVQPLTRKKEASAPNAAADRRCASAMAPVGDDRKSRPTISVRSPARGPPGPDISRRMPSGVARPLWVGVRGGRTTVECGRTEQAVVSHAGCSMRREKV
ncbi:MAG: hypothetical protein J3K34DRAFT_433229 [Monoraphidium minutum]|nr:MAG: hypothetical protein J3K34DRAFT_433229 [Monoraphidium minutum]